MIYLKAFSPLLVGVLSETGHLAGRLAAQTPPLSSHPTGQGAQLKPPCCCCCKYSSSKLSVTYWSGCSVKPSCARSFRGFRRSFQSPTGRGAQ